MCLLQGLDAVYAICFQSITPGTVINSVCIAILFSSGQDVVLVHVKSTDHTKVTLLGMEGDLDFTIKPDGLRITIPNSLPYTLLPRIAITLKMTGVIAN